MTRPVRTVHSDHGVNHGSHSVGVICRIYMRPRTTTKNKKQNKKLNEATIESRMTAMERIHTQAIEMVRVVQQQQAKCNWKVTKINK